MITLSSFVATASDVRDSAVEILYTDAEWSGDSTDSLKSRNIAAINSAERLCRGVVISPSWVLTAAHCVKDFYARELLVRNSIASESKSMPHILNYDVQDVIVHPDYDEANLNSDVALLRVVSKQSNFEPDLVIGWKQALQNFESLNPENYLQIYSGHITTPDIYTANGKNNDSKWQLLDYDQCQSAIKSAWLNRGLTTEEPLIESDQICLLASSAEYATCHGDSGSPVYLATDEGVFIAGLVSWNYQCNNPEFPTALVDLELHKDWIASVVSKLQVKSIIDLGVVPVDKKFYTSVDIYNPDYQASDIYLDFPGSPSTYVEVIGNSCGTSTSPVCKVDLQITVYQSGAIDEEMYLLSSDGRYKKVVHLKANAGQLVATSNIDELTQVEWFSDSSDNWRIYGNNVEHSSSSGNQDTSQRLLGLIKTTSEEIFKVDRSVSCKNSIYCADIQLLLNKKQIKNDTDNSWTFKTLPNITYALEFVNQTPVERNHKGKLLNGELADSHFTISVMRPNKKTSKVQVKESGGALNWCWLFSGLFLLKRKKPAQKLAFLSKSPS
ncbi:MAG: trypsin-like serine protease [Gammaproteobacteria bacterium]|nr:trypsin-like serine protease [Gammaproteobacteria bacterium]